MTFFYNLDFVTEERALHATVWLELGLKTLSQNVSFVKYITMRN